MNKLHERMIHTTLALLFGVFGTTGIGQAATPLKTTAGSAAESHNAEGITHYDQGHLPTAAKHFQAAVTADPQSAEAHYNLALTLDKMGQHMDAARHFKMASDLGKDNPDIQNSAILQAHIKKLPPESGTAPPPPPSGLQVQ